PAPAENRALTRAPPPGPSAAPWAARRAAEGCSYAPLRGQQIRQRVGLQRQPHRRAVESIQRQQPIIPPAVPSGSAEPRHEDLELNSGIVAEAAYLTQIVHHVPALCRAQRIV